MRISHADGLLPRDLVARLAHEKQQQAQQQRSEVHGANVRRPAAIVESCRSTSS